MIIYGFIMVCIHQIYVGLHLGMIDYMHGFLVKQQVFPFSLLNGLMVLVWLEELIYIGS